MDYNINPPQYTGSLAPRVTGCPQPNQTGLSPRELFGMPTSTTSANIKHFPEKKERYEYGNARFRLYRHIAKNGELLLEYPHENLFRKWVVKAANYPDPDDIYTDIDVAIGDIIEVKMGNGDASSASHEFWTKYEIGSKPRR